METMTPELKAKEIFNQMKGFRVKHSHSKKCALNLVREIISALALLGNYSPEIKKEIAYWGDIENELLKMKV